MQFCRMNFNQAEEEYIDGEDTIGLGTLGKEGSGRSVSANLLLCRVLQCCAMLRSTGTKALTAALLMYWLMQLRWSWTRTWLHMRQ